MHASSEPTIDTPENSKDISISDAGTQSGDEHEPSNNDNDDVHVDSQPSNDNDVEIEPAVDLDNPQPKNKRYDKRYSIHPKILIKEMDESRRILVIDASNFIHLFDKYFGTEGVQIKS